MNTATSAVGRSNFRLKRKSAGHLRSGLHQESHLRPLVTSDAVAVRRARRLTCPDVVEFFCQFWKDGARRYGLVTSAENLTDFGGESSETVDGFLESHGIRARTENIDSSRIISVASEQKPMGLIEEANGVWSVARRGQDIERSSAQIDRIPIV